MATTHDARQDTDQQCPIGANGFDHGAAFHHLTVDTGFQASEYFARSGIRREAQRSGGACTFIMGGETAVYQASNHPIVTDDDLVPTTAAAADLFGDFMGSLPNSRADRPYKRAIIERVLSNARFIDDITPDVGAATLTFAERSLYVEQSVEDFCVRLVAYVDSVVPGVLDLRDAPLNTYLESPEYGPTLRRYFEIASEVISKVHSSAMREFDNILDLVRSILLANFASLQSAPATNMIRGYFVLWELPFSRDTIEHLDLDKIKEIATVIIATYDTTALALSWTLAFVARTADLRAQLSAGGADTAVDSRIRRSEMAVLEAVRYSGGNPTALWRRTTESIEVTVDGRAISVPAGTRLWLDRYAANRDPDVFPNPENYDVGNIAALVSGPKETVSSILSRNRYEINSFNMVNTIRNPRKCPGRLFAIKMQAVLLETLYRNFSVTITGTDVDFRRHSSMPRPASAGTIVLEPNRRGEDR